MYQQVENFRLFDWRRVNVVNKGLPVHAPPQSVSGNQKCFHLYVLIRRLVEPFQEFIKFLIPLFMQCGKRYVLK